MHIEECFLFGVHCLPSRRSLTKVLKQVKIRAVQGMKLKHLTVGLRPELYQYLEERAECAGVSTDRYAAMSLELMHAKAAGGVKEGEEEVEPYSMEELDESIREAKEAIQEVKSGKLKPYETTEELFNALGI